MSKCLIRKNFGFKSLVINIFERGFGPNGATQPQLNQDIRIEVQGVRGRNRATHVRLPVYFDKTGSGT